MRQSVSGAIFRVLRAIAPSPMYPIKASSFAVSHGATNGYWRLITAIATALANNTVSTTCGTVFYQRRCNHAELSIIHTPRTKNSV